MTEKQHEALTLPLSERVDYLTVVASMAGADVMLEPEETAKLKALCHELGLPSEETKRVLEASQAATTAVKRHLEGLKESSLRFALLKDCISLAYADGKYEESERLEVLSLAHQLDVKDDQVKAIETLVATCNAAAGGGPASSHLGKELAENLVGVGIPVGILGAMSAVGLEMTGAATGLAALGLGLGAATGVGAVFGLGVGTYMGVRWLMNKAQHKPA